MVTNAPHNDTAMSNVEFFKICGCPKNNRNKPYPPNFSRTPAKIIEPATGASTWAFGNHKWRV